MFALDLVMRMETMPLAIVTVLPLSVSVTFAPVPVPPPGRLAKAVMAFKKNASASERTAIFRKKFEVSMRSDSELPQPDWLPWQHGRKITAAGKLFIGVMVEKI